MFYVYVLRSKLKPDKFYRGYTSNLNQRFSQHNRKQVVSTKDFVPWELVYYEAYLTKELATARENVLKQRGKIWQSLKRRLNT